MSYQSAYTVRHVFLNEKIIDFSDLSVIENGNYLVFWWRKIPLGHLYIEKNTYYNDRDFRLKIYEAIKSTINHYSLNVLNDRYEQALIDNDQESFSAIMDDIFVDFNLKKYPEQVEISVVICTRNRSEDLKICIENLLKQVSIPKEILVIDNAPADNSTKTVANQYESVTYYCEVRPGLDNARNLGAKKARFPIIGYVDDDVKVDSDWSYRIWEAFQEPNVGAMTGLILAASLETESQQIFEKHWNLNKGYIPKKFDLNFVTVTNKVPRVWDIGAGANMAFRKSVLEKVNYFDERLDAGAAGCNGDTEIWHRILLAGYTIYYNPLSIVSHKHRKTLKELKSQIFYYMRGHAAAALIQHSQNPSAGYRRYLYIELMKYYFLLIRIGFPSYSFRYRTVFIEIKGLISGIRYYIRYRNKPPLTES